MIELGGYIVNETLMGGGEGDAQIDEIETMIHCVIWPMN